MADKQTINVTKCMFFDKLDSPNGCTCYWDGECNHDCYYKQLKHKEQECEELKKRVCGLRPELKYVIEKVCYEYNIEAKNYHERIVKIINKLDEYKQTLAEIKKYLGISHKTILERLEELTNFRDRDREELDQLKQTLAEIKEIAETCSFADSSELLLKRIKLILQKISEVIK